MKRFVSLILLICVLAGLCLTASAADDDIKVVINSQELECADKPLIENGRTLVPIRALAEAMGCKVTWIASIRTANIENESIKIGMKIDSTLISKQKITNKTVQSVIKTDVPPRIINNRTYIPARAFAEALEAAVGWDAKTRTVMIIYDTTLRYTGGCTVETFAGNAEKTHHDGALNTMSFVSPESITEQNAGKLLVTDSGMLRELSGGFSQTLKFEPSYITAANVCCHGNDIYVLTHEFQNSDGQKYYGIVKLTSDAAEGLFVTEARYSTIPDFDISKDGKLYVIYNNLGVGKTYLGQLDTATGKVQYLTEIDDGIKALTVDDNGNVFLANTVKGSVYFYDVAANSIRLFAGVDDKVKFVDGTTPLFVEPRRLAYHKGYLYVLDYNIVRRISVNSANICVSCETLAGKVTVEQNPQTTDGKGSDVTFAPSYLMDLTVTDAGVYLTDPKHAVVRFIHLA